MHSEFVLNEQKAFITIKEKILTQIEQTHSASEKTTHSAIAGTENETVIEGGRALLVQASLRKCPCTHNFKSIECIWN